MKFFTLLSISSLFFFSNVFAQTKEPEVKVIKYEELFEKIQQPTDQLIVVNFWATWCGPCVKEMPAFVEVYNQYKDNPKFKLLLVSMDRAKQVDAVKKFMLNNKVEAEVVLLDDNKRMRDWIPAIDPSWSGNIPVTVLFKNTEKLHFVGTEISKSELDQLITTYIN